MCNITLSDLRQAAQQAQAAMIALRHELHQHPEVRFQERWTSDRIAQALDHPAITVTRGWAGGTGIVGEIRGRANRIIAFRADMDALEINEASQHTHSSKTPGRMHACGHDGHIAMLCGAAGILAERPEQLDCTVRVIFQPGEEMGLGGRRMVEEGALDGVETVFGMHGWPGIPLGRVGMKPGIAMAGADWFHITVGGRGGHGAVQTAGADAILAAAHVVMALRPMTNNAADLDERAVVSIGSIHGGETHNSLPETVSLAGSCRTFTAETRERLRAAVQQTAAATAAALGAHAATAFNDDWYIPLHNHPDAVAFAQRAIDDGLGAGTAMIIAEPSTASEDFAYYLQQVPGAFLWLGTEPPGETLPGLHSPYFDFNDDALVTGINVWLSLAHAFSTGCGK